MPSLSCCARRPCRVWLSRQFSDGVQRCFMSSATNAGALRTASAMMRPILNYRDISENVVYKMSNAVNRKSPITPLAIQSVVRDYKSLKDLSSSLNAKRNTRSMIGDRIKKFGQEKNQEALIACLEEAKTLKEEISQLEKTVSELEQSLLDKALLIPNDTHPNSPLGPESSAITLSSHGPSPGLASPHRDHYTISQSLGLVDFENAAIVTGASWYYLKHEAALLELALTNYAMSIAMKQGFVPIMTPDVVKGDVAKRCGFQPRDESDPLKSQVYHVDSHLSTSSQRLVLSGTSEIPLAGLCANQLYPKLSLPLKMVGLGHAFRSEAGARGADTRGLYRVHQFTKVELFAITTETESDKMMEDMKNLQIAIFDGLGIPFRVLDMPTEELGASAYRKYDIEAWMPGRGNWGEISSLSNCTDYQARRLSIKYQRPIVNQQGTATHENVYVHTLNGTAAAIPRLIVALLENGATFDENSQLTGLTLPDVLRPFWLGQPHQRNIIQWV
ncbi:uncharacterized protein EV420DRAFT_1511610 [Desarmillaria tabescens]|uniref:serine--tRNA ligase n=1 Tax=Armillaria tabescens TaxID=1929756 RepID=A0AA39TPZ2_ARMTA|nr:uncharacterized protein EV420DRAFT_1511610 [Desarmillaria tabescens]KAK0466437.1 hypothetical protein EV420DRAFT_1511610 [Desarmillaria tabescens]